MRSVGGDSSRLGTSPDALSREMGLGCRRGGTNPQYTRPVEGLADCSVRSHPTCTPADLNGAGVTPHAADARLETRHRSVTTPPPPRSARYGLAKSDIVLARRIRLERRLSDASDRFRVSGRGRALPDK